MQEQQEAEVADAQPPVTTGKRKWVRRVLIVSGILLGALVVAAAILLLTLDLVAAGAIRKIGPMVTQTPFQVKSVRIYPFRGRVELDGLRVGNPPGFTRPDVFVLERFVLDVDMGTVTSPRILVSEVRVDGMDVDYEPALDERGSNVAVIQRNVEDFLQKLKLKSEKKAAAQSTEKTPAAPPPKVVIQLLEVGGVKLCSGAIALPLPGIVMHDLGDDNGKSWSDITNDFFNVLINNAVVESGKAGIKLLGSGVMTGVDATGKALGSGVDASGKVISATGDAVSATGEAAEKGVKSVVDGVTNLFNTK